MAGAVPGGLARRRGVHGEEEAPAAAARRPHLGHGLHLPEKGRNGVGGRLGGQVAHAGRDGPRRASVPGCRAHWRRGGECHNNAAAPATTQRGEARMGWLGRLALAALLLCGPAAAQVKPPAAGDAAPAAPDKFAAPAARQRRRAANVAAAGRQIRRAAHAGARRRPGAATDATASAPRRPRRAAPPAPPPVPANEPAAVARLRALLGPETALTYRSAESIDPARGSVRLLGVAMDGRGRRVTMEELTLDGLRDDGVVEATARARRGAGPRGKRHGRRGCGSRACPCSARRPAPSSGRTWCSLDALRIEGLRMTGSSDATIAELLGGGLRRRPRRPGFARPASTMRAPRSGNRVAAARAALRGLDLAAGFGRAGGAEAPPRTQGSYGLEVEGVSVRDGGRRSSAASARSASPARCRRAGPRPAASRCGTCGSSPFPASPNGCAASATRR